MSGRVLRVAGDKAHADRFARQIILQAIVRGPDHAVCELNGEAVRASVSHPFMDQAIAWVVVERADTLPEVVAGFSPEVRPCDDYRDTLGHFTVPGALAAARARQLAPAYRLNAKSEFRQRAFEDFVARCGRAGRRVIVLTGQFNPLLGRQLAPAVRADMLAFLNRLKARHPHLVLVPETGLPLQTSADCEDLSDVHPAAQRRFSAALAGLPWTAGGSLPAPVTNNSYTTFRVEALDPGLIQTYDDWAFYHGLSGNEALPTADPDGDKMPNRLESFFGRNPRVTESAPALTLSLNRTAAPPTVTIQFTRSAHAAALGLGLKTSGNLMDWTVFTDFTVTVTPLTPTVELVQISIPAREWVAFWTVGETPAQTLGR